MKLLRVVGLACLWAVSADASDLPPLRIQPLGDSITKGSLSSHNNGYRGYLRNMLVKESDNGVDMIGSMRHGTMRDNDHEGHSGHFLAEIVEYWKLSIRARPNLVLLHAGTNNMDKEIDLDESPDLIESIIDGVGEEAPDAAILVMPVIWANDTRMQKNTDHFNEILEGIIKEKQDGGKHVLSVPTNITLADLADFKHPNDQGYEKMAKAWFEAILDANERGWLKAPEKVDPRKLPGMGLGTRGSGGGSPSEGEDENDENDENDEEGDEGNEGDGEGDDKKDDDTGDDTGDEDQDNDQDSSAPQHYKVLSLGASVMMVPLLYNTL